MKSINYRANLIPNGRLEIGAQVSQYDVGRIIDVYIRDQGDEYTIPSDAVCTLNARKPDNTIYSETLEHTTEYAEVVTSEQLTCVSGKVVCEIRITSDGVDIGTANFVLKVEASPIESGTASDSTITSIVAYLQTAVEAAADAQAAAESATEAAEAAASSAESAAESAEEAATNAANCVSISSIEQTETSEESEGENIITITFTTGDTASFSVYNGAKGETGDAGADGADGKSAYEYAVEAGYTGTEEEFSDALSTITSLINAEEEEY